MSGRLDEILAYEFRDESLRRQALTHRSFGTPHNERLEFLGDSVLNLIVAAELFRRFPKLREGDLSRLRAQLVRENTLREIAETHGLAHFLHLGEGEAKSGGLQRASILADALEALLGAVFLDSGFDAARRIVIRLFEPYLGALDTAAPNKDSKTLLQEHLQGRRLPLPHYDIVAARGAAHEQIFEVECVIESVGLRTRGKGTSRRLAEQDAARQALDALIK